MRYSIVIFLCMFIMSGCVSVSDDPPADTTAPLWANNYPKVQNSQETRFEIKTRMNEGGRVYFAVLSNGEPEPSSAQIKSGSVPGSVTNGSCAVGADTIDTISIAGLTSIATQELLQQFIRMAFS